MFVLPIGKLLSADRQRMCVAFEKNRKGTQKKPSCPSLGQDGRLPGAIQSIGPYQEHLAYTNEPLPDNKMYIYK